MSMTDPISDLLTRIRNGHTAKHSSVAVPASKMKLEIVKILEEEGYIDGHHVEGKDVQDVIHVKLKYMGSRGQAITGLQRVSKPGRRIYCGRNDVPKVLNGLGVTIVSTSQGIKTGAACSKLGIGGEVLCHVW
jgi:small subunit ribosomal protein S8